MGDQVHPEREGPLGHQLPDPSEADDSERLVGQLDTVPLRTLPSPGPQRRMGLRDVARLTQQERHGVLGRGQRVRLRSVDHHHAPRRRGGRVDVVEPDSGPSDHDEVRRGVEQVGGDLGRRPDDECVGTDDRLRHLVGRQIEPDVDIVSGRAETVQTGRGQRFGYQDSGHVWGL